MHTGKIETQEKQKHRKNRNTGKIETVSNRNMCYKNEWRKLKTKNRDSEKFDINGRTFINGIPKSLYVEYKAYPNPYPYTLTLAQPAHTNHNTKPTHTNHNTKPAHTNHNTKSENGELFVLALAP